jgi:hypothetical protein
VTLSNLIRKRDTGNLATAIPAISATDGLGSGGTVARIATVAVANPQEEKTAPPEKSMAGTTAPPSRWWLIHYMDRDPLETFCAPAVSRAWILEHSPGAVSAEPLAPPVPQPPAPITADEEAAIRAWLALIEETDPPTIAEAIERCQCDADARDYFIGRAVAELPNPDPIPDDRRTCNRCANLTGRRCQAASRGEIVASPTYEPVRDLPRRCEGYTPGMDDSDRRPGRERWPELTDTKGTT